MGSQCGSAQVCENAILTPSHRDPMHFLAGPRVGTFTGFLELLRSNKSAPKLVVKYKCIAPHAAAACGIPPPPPPSMQSRARACSGH